MLHTCVATTDPDLTTTGALKALVLGATATSTAQDAHMANCIRRASRWAASYLGYPLAVASYQETLPGFGTRRLMVSRTPIRAVPRLFDSTDTGNGEQVLSSEFRVESRDAGFLSRDAGWEWTVPVESEVSARPVPGDEYRPWLVDYVAGWTYDGLSTSSPHWSTEQGTTDTGRTLPEDIEEAVLLKAQSLFDNDAEVTMEKLGDLQVNYQSGGIDRAGNPVLSPWELALEPYRRVV